MLVRVARGRHLPSRGDRHAGRELLDRDPAAERHRRAPHGSRAQRHDAGRAHAQAAHAGPQALWALGTDHAGIATQVVVESSSRAEGTSARGARPRGVRAARLGVAGAVRLDDRRAVQAPRRVVRLRARALHDGRGLRARGLQGLQGPLRQGLHLPRQLHGELGPWLARPRSPTSRWSTARSRTPSTSSTTRSSPATGHVTVATVRPETMLADTAVAVNPNDERYFHLIGQAAMLPLVGRRLPIIADDHVDPEFGTGALKITPGHDPNDFEIGRKPRARGDLGDRRGRAHERSGRRAVRGPVGHRGARRRWWRRSTSSARSRSASRTSTPSGTATARA